MKKNIALALLAANIAFAPAAALAAGLSNEVTPVNLGAAQRPTTRPAPGTTTPDTQPATPGTTTPDTQPATPGTTTPDTQPAKPGTTTPDTQPAKPGTTPDTQPAKPGTTPDTQPAKPGTTTPDTQPAKPGTTKPDTQPAKPGTTTPDTQPAKPGTTTPDTQPAKPGTTKPDTQPAKPGTTTPDTQPAKPGTTTPDTTTPAQPQRPTPRPAATPAPSESPELGNNKPGVIDRAIEVLHEEDYSYYEEEREVVRICNEERARMGLAPLKLNWQLARMARFKAEDMRDTMNFDHESRIYGTPFEMLASFNIPFEMAGENIAKGKLSAQEVVDAWLTSEGHRKNILNPNFTEIGVGFAESEKGSYWAEVLIRPETASVEGR